MSSKPHRTTIPLPPATLEALRYVYRARGLSSRRLASSIGTTFPHVGRIIAGKSRPSVVLAERIGVALDLPPEFTALVMEQSATLGRKMRTPDGFDGPHGPVGVQLCPVAECRAHALMEAAMRAGGWHRLADEFNDRVSPFVVAIAPAMGGPIAWTGAPIDPWAAADIAPLVAWRGDPAPPAKLPTERLAEFIASVSPAAVIRCRCHERP